MNYICTLEGVFHEYLSPVYTCISVWYDTYPFKPSHQYVVGVCVVIAVVTHLYFYYLHITSWQRLILHRMKKILFIHIH